MVWIYWNLLKINIPYQLQICCCRRKVMHSCWFWWFPRTWLFTCWAQLLTEVEQFYPKQRLEHWVLLQRLPWKGEGDLLLQRQRGSFWSNKDFSPGCHNKQLLIEAALAECKVSTAKRQRCAPSGQLLFEGNNKLRVWLCFSQFGSKQGFSCVCRQRTPLNRSPCIPQCCMMCLRSLRSPQLSLLIAVVSLCEWCESLVFSQGYNVQGVHVFTLISELKFQCVTRPLDQKKLSPL